MKRYMIVLTVIGILVQGVAVLQAGGVSAEYRERAAHQLDTALGLVGTVTFDTSQMTYLRAGEVVEDLGGGKKKMKVDTVPGGPMEVWQDGPQTSAVLGITGKGELTLKPGEVTMSVDYGKGKKATHLFPLPLKLRGDSSSPGGSSDGQMFAIFLLVPLAQAAPIPMIPVALAGLHLEEVDVKESGGKLTLTESQGGNPVRERIVDASTGQLLSDREMEGGKSFEEKTFTGTTMVKGLPLPTAIRFAWFTPTGDPQRVVDVTDIKYDLK